MRLSDLLSGMTPERRVLTVSVTTLTGNNFVFETRGSSPRAFHAFIEQARASEQGWVSVDAYDDETGEPYVTGFDPRLILTVDIQDNGEADPSEVTGEEDGAEDGPCGPDCSCFPQPGEEPAQGVSPEVPGADTRPFTMTEAAALDRDPADAPMAAPRGPVPPQVAGALLLAALLGGLRPPPGAGR